MVHRYVYRPDMVHRGLAVYRVGVGEPVLLMPGPHRFQIPSDGSAGPLIEGLVGIGRQVISFDPPGSGHSTRPSNISMAEMHTCATEALTACGIHQPVDAVGHSMGGLCALAYAIEQPTRVRRLVLIGTGWGGPAYLDAPGALWNRSHPGFWRMALLGCWHLVWPSLASERRLNNYVRRASYVDERHVTADPVGWRDWLRPRRGRADWHKLARRMDYSPRLPDVTAPTLILCGRHDPQFPLASSQRLHTDLHDSRMVIFERSGHFPFIEEPDQFWECVAAFLDDSAPTTGG